MHFIDRLVDSLLVFFPQNTIVLDVVDQLKEEHTIQGVHELVFER